MEMKSPHQVVELLNRAAKDYAEAEQQVRDGHAAPDIGRAMQVEAMMHALSAARGAAALIAAPALPPLLEPLDRLYAALARLCSGRPDPILNPVRAPKSGSKPKDGAIELAVKAMVVAAARTLIEASTSQRKASEADAWVAARAEALGITGPHGKTISPDMVRNWRSTYKQNPALLEAVAEHVAIPPATDLQEARSHAESLLGLVLRIPGWDVSG